jgi:hypothetical protein
MSAEGPPWLERAEILSFEDQREREHEESIGTRVVEFLRGIVPP